MSQNWNRAQDIAVSLRTPTHLIALAPLHHFTMEDKADCNKGPADAITDPAVRDTDKQSLSQPHLRNMMAMWTYVPSISS